MSDAPLVIDYVRALRDSTYRRELSEELETGVTSMIMEEAADEIERLRADLSPQWQPIETAPKDGAVVDLWVKSSWGA